MGQQMCKTVSVKKKGTTTYSVDCDFGVLKTVKDTVQLKTNTALFILIGQLFLLFVFWICTFKSKLDFTKTYLISVVGPMTIDVFIKTALSVISLYGGDTRSGGVQLLFHLDAYFDVAYHYTFTINTIIFILMTFYVAKNRKRMSRTAERAPYAIVGGVFFVVAAYIWLPYSMGIDAYNNVYTAIVVMSSVASAVVSALFLMMCCACCCCSRPKPDQDWADPVVYNARSRMGWLMVFLLFVPATTVLDAASAGQQNEGTRWILYGISFMSPFFILVPVFLFLPTYRSALFFCCGSNNNNGEIIDGAKKPINSSATIMAQNGPVAHTISQNQPAEPKGYPTASYPRQPSLAPTNQSPHQSIQTQPWPQSSLPPIYPMQTQNVSQLPNYPMQGPTVSPATNLQTNQTGLYPRLDASEGLAPTQYGMGHMGSQMGPYYPNQQLSQSMFQQQPAANPEYSNQLVYDGSTFHGHMNPQNIESAAWPSSQSVDRPSQSHLSVPTQDPGSPSPIAPPAPQSPHSVD